MKDPTDSYFEALAHNIDVAEIVADGNDADFLVAPLVTTPLILPDNLIGHCSNCFRMVQFRPTAPKLPRRLCPGCAGRAIAKADDTRFLLTEKTVGELVNHIKKKVGN